MQLLLSCWELRDSLLKKKPYFYYPSVGGAFRILLMKERNRVVHLPSPPIINKNAPIKRDVFLYGWARCAIYELNSLTFVKKNDISIKQNWKEVV